MLTSSDHLLDLHVLGYDLDLLQHLPNNYCSLFNTWESISGALCPVLDSPLQGTYLSKSTEMAEGPRQMIK